MQIPAYRKAIENQWKDAMRTMLKFAAAVVTGAYRFKDSSMNGTMVLNVHGNEAELFGDLGKDGIKPLGKMKASVKDEKLLLDAVNSSTRLVMRRNVEERSLD